MDFKNRHPLNAIEGYESLSMLEALIPFVDYSLKLPLALFLKYSETKLIIKCFQSTDNLIRLGLHNPCNDPLDMICSLTGISSEILKMLFSMMDGSGNSMFSNLFNNSSGMDTASSSFSPEDISNAMNMFQSMQSGFWEQQSHPPTHENNLKYDNNHPPNAHFDDHSFNTPSGDFEQNIQQLLAEYDLTQAEHFEESNRYSEEEYESPINNSSSQYPY